MQLNVDQKSIDQQIQEKEAEAREVMQWLTDHAQASPDAREEMKRRRTEILQAINDLVCSKYPPAIYPCR